jgi:hypothetical protein
MPREADALVQVAGDRFLRFKQSVGVVEARSLEDVPDAIARVEAITQTRGYHAVGFVTYEAGAAFGLDVADSSPELPFVWFGLKVNYTLCLPAPTVPSSSREATCGKRW